MGKQKCSSYISLFPSLAFVLVCHLLTSRSYEKKNVLRWPHTVIWRVLKIIWHFKTLRHSVCILGKDGFIFLWLRLFILEWQYHFKSNELNKWGMPHDLSRAMISHACSDVQFQTYVSLWPYFKDKAYCASSKEVRLKMKTTLYLHHPFGLKFWKGILFKASFEKKRIMQDYLMYYRWGQNSLRML